MTTIHRLSLTLLLVAPLIATRESSVEEEEEVSTTEQEIPIIWKVPLESLDIGSTWARRKRSIDVPGEVMETAEQVMFRPLFRHRQMIQERQQREQLRVELRRQLQQTSKPKTVSPLSVQKAYYPYQKQSLRKPAYNYYASGDFRPSLSQPFRPPQSVYHTYYQNI